MFTTSLAKATECYWSISEILADCPPTLAGLGQLVRCRKQLLGPSPQQEAVQPFATSKIDWLAVTRLDMKLRFGILWLCKGFKGM